MSVEFGDVFDGTFELRDVQRRLVYTESISTNLHTFTFNGAKGLYTYRIVSNREMYTGKLVFE